MSVIGNVTVQTLYTIAGLENPLIVEPALKAQVEHRSGELSRRGFLGLVGAATAGMVFDPVSKLWTPAKEATVVLAEQAVVSMDAAMLHTVRWLVEAVERVVGDMPVRVRRDIESRRHLTWVTEGGWPTSRNVVRTCPNMRPGDTPTPGRIWSIGQVRPFNEDIPLPVLAYEHDPTVRVADVLSPSGYLCRAFAYEAYDGMKRFPMVEFELMGRYVERGELRDLRGRRFKRLV